MNEEKTQPSVGPKKHKLTRPAYIGKTDQRPGEEKEKLILKHNELVRTISQAIDLMESGSKVSYRKLIRNLKREIWVIRVKLGLPTKA